MILQARVAIIVLINLVLVSSGQTCREHSATNSPAIMSNQTNRNESQSKTAQVVWGGPHVRLVITSGGGEIEFDCAHGEIKEPLKWNEQGGFNVAGTFVREGGPTRSDEPEAGRPARYSGRVVGDKMTLTVTLADSNEKLNEFSLTRGNEGQLRKCK